MGMSLTRLQKRNLAIVLTSQARQAVNDWDKIKYENFEGVEPGVLEGISAEEASWAFGSWLRYLPNKPAADMLPAENDAAVVDREPVAVEPDAELVDDEPEEEHSGKFSW